LHKNKVSYVDAAFFYPLPNNRNGFRQMAFYRFAGLTIDMEPKHPTLIKQSEPYRMATHGKKADILIRQPEGYIQQMQAANPVLTPDQCEYIRFSTCFYRSLLCFDGMMLHSSAVAVDDRAYLFTAPSGTGKSTHTSQWLQLFQNRALIINDDKPALRWIDKQLCACGTPFSGKTAQSRNVCIPVAGICILERGKTNQIKSITAKQAIPILYEQTIHSLRAQKMEQLLAMLQSVVEAIPLYRMRCTIGVEAARTAYEGMSQSGQRRKTEV
jgi:hypothetical protein